MGRVHLSDASSQRARGLALDPRSPGGRVLLGLIGLTVIMVAISLVYDVGAWRAGHLTSREPLPRFTSHLALASVTSGR